MALQRGSGTSMVAIKFPWHFLDLFLDWMQVIQVIWVRQNKPGPRQKNTFYPKLWRQVFFSNRDGKNVLKSNNFS